MSPLEIGLDEIAGQEQRQNDQADQVQIDQQEDEGIAGAGQKVIRLLTQRNGRLRIVETSGPNRAVIG